MLLGVVLGGALFARGLLAIAFPPYGYDPLWYHLAGAAHWLQVGRIEAVDWSLIVGRYPGDSDLLVMAPAVFVRSVHALAIGGLFAAVLFVLGTRALARTLGLGARASWFAGLLAGATPVAVAQTYSGYVDLFVAAWAVVAATMVAEAARAASARDGRRFLADAVWVGVACGLLAGSKYSGIPPAGAAMLAIGAVGHRSPLRRLTGRGVAIVVLVAVAMGGSWYLRNAIEEHNPIAPFRVALFGHEVFAGEGQPADWLTPPPDVLVGLPKPAQLVGGWGLDAEILVQPRALSEQETRGGLGLVWLLFGLPSLLAVGVLAARRRISVEAPVTASAGVLLIAALGQPYWWWSRFVLALVPLGTMAFVWVLPRVVRTTRVRALELGAVAVASYGVALGVVHLGFPDDEWSATVVAATRLAIEQRGDVGYADVMASQAWNDRVPRDGRVGLDTALSNTEAGGFVLLPLFGQDLSHRVISLGPDDSFDRFDAVVVLESGTRASDVEADGRFERIDPSPRGLVAFVRR